jgi:cell division protease FtsH
MSQVLGPVAFEKPQSQFLEGMPAPRRSVSPQVNEIIDREVKAITDGAHHIALTILTTNRELLEETAQALLETEVLEGQALRSRLDRVQLPPEVKDWLLSGTLIPDSIDRKMN